MISDAPLVAYLRRHGYELGRIAPWVVSTLVVLLLATAAGGPEAFGLALGLGGVLLGVWGGLLAARASEATQEMHGKVEDVQMVTDGLRRAIDQMAALEDLRVLYRLWDILLPLLIRARGWADEPQVLRLSDKERRSFQEQLRPALDIATDTLPLTACRNLDQGLSKAGHWGVYGFTDLDDVGPLVVKAYEEVVSYIIDTGGRLHGL